MFWDTDLGTFNPADYPDYSRLRETFREDEIRRVLMTERRMSPKSATFGRSCTAFPRARWLRLSPRVIEFMAGSAAGRTWHRETITAGTEATLIGLRDAVLLDRAYLAGGTELALQMRPGLSLDLDFFIP